MKRLLFLALLIPALCLANFTEEQYQSLSAYAKANPTALACITAKNDICLREWLNSPSGFIVFKSRVPISTVGEHFVGSGLSAMTSANNDRLVSFALWNPNGVNPNRFDHRDFFESVFSPASGASTRSALYALWRRNANNLEKAFTTGTGTDANPGALGYEGTATNLIATKIIFNENGTLR